MSKVSIRILDTCPSCKGVAYLFVREALDNNGNPYDRYRACRVCDGTGTHPRWVSLDKFLELLMQHQEARELDTNRFS